MSALGMSRPDAIMNSREMIEGYSTGKLSPVEVTELVLRKIEELNDRLGAFVAVDPEGAIRSAKESESRWESWRQANRVTKESDWQRLPTWGVPISVKDTIELEGLPTTYGSLAFADNYQPDSPIVSVLREAGCILLGKTNTSEFALSMVTATRAAPPARNPYDLDRTAGGSSGGAAAATIAGMGVFGLGTDSVGSIRQPAAYCGLYGLKPTFGRVKNRQRWRASPVRSHLGPLAKHVNDLVYSWRVLTGDSEPLLPLEAAEQTRPIRVACLADDPDAGSVLSEGVQMLRQLGNVEVCDSPPRLAEPPHVYSRDGDWVFAADHYAAAEKLVPGFMDAHRDQLTGYTRSVYDLGARIPAWEYRLLMAEVEDFRATSQEIFEHADLIVTSVAGPPPALDESGNLDDLGPKYPQLSVWNLGGNPALAMPLPPGDDGLPRSIQLVTRHGEDRLLLRLALSLARQSSGMGAASH